MKTDIYTLAHEVKNPLCVVKGYLEMMNERNYSKYKDIINNEINMSLEILDSYLSLKKMTIEKEEMDFNLLLLDIKKSMKEYLKKSSITLNIKMMDDEIYLEADYNKLKQVFYNIIKNSIEAHAKNIEISYQIWLDKLIITIINDGDKIPIDKISKVGSSYSSKIYGHGIGINLSKQIIKMHDGKIKYANNKDKGIKITITLNLS